MANKDNDFSSIDDTLDNLEWDNYFQATLNTTYNPHMDGDCIYCLLRADDNALKVNNDLYSELRPYKKGLEALDLIRQNGNKYQLTKMGRRYLNYIGYRRGLLNMNIHWIIYMLMWYVIPIPVIVLLFILGTICLGQELPVWGVLCAVVDGIIIPMDAVLPQELRMNISCFHTHNFRKKNFINFLINNRSTNSFRKVEYDYTHTFLENDMFDDQ